MNRWLLRRRMAVLSAMVLALGLLTSQPQAAAPAKTVVDVTYYFLPG